MQEHNIVELLHRGVSVGINADDPAYFGGYMNDNFNAVAQTLLFTQAELAQFTRNAIAASFCLVKRKQQLHALVLAYLAQMGVSY